MSNFSNNLKKLMQERGVSAKVIREATGIPGSTLSEWTTGRDPRLTDAVVRLARFFGVSVEYLITGKEPETDLVAELLDAKGDGFAVIHRGVYRVRVEKFTGRNKKGGGASDD